MKTKEFIEKWLVGYESLEQKAEFSIEMETDLEDLSNTSKWISTETMPDYDGRYLCYIKQVQECDNVWEYQAVRDCTINLWSTLANETITHWMPLPNAPEKP